METAVKKYVKFPLGKTVSTAGVNARIASDVEFSVFVYQSLRRHAKGDWGDLEGEDKEMNEIGLIKGKEGRLLSRYNFQSDRGLDIYIITEWDRSSTCILFPREY